MLGPGEVKVLGSRQVNRAVMGWGEHLRGSAELLVTNWYKLEYFRPLPTGMMLLECPAGY